VHPDGLVMALPRPTFIINIEGVLVVCGKGSGKPAVIPTGSGRVRVRCRPWEKPQKPPPVG
jgi:hypothetical protein